MTPYLGGSIIATAIQLHTYIDHDRGGAMLTHVVPMLIEVNACLAIFSCILRAKLSALYSAIDSNAHPGVGDSASAKSSSDDPTGKPHAQEDERNQEQVHFFY